MAWPKNKTLFRRKKVAKWWSSSVLFSFFSSPPSAASVSSSFKQWGQPCPCPSVSRGRVRACVLCTLNTCQPHLSLHASLCTELVGWLFLVTAFPMRFWASLEQELSFSPFYFQFLTQYGEHGKCPRNLGEVSLEAEISVTWNQLGCKARDSLSHAWYWVDLKGDICLFENDFAMSDTGMQAT